MGVASSDTTLPGRIQEAREAAGLTQEQLAREADLSLASVSKWEQGTRTPTIGSLRKIAAATGKPLAFFVADEVAA